MVGAWWHPRASVLVCESWTGPWGSEVCVRGRLPGGRGAPQGLSQGWVSSGEELSAWTPPCLDHSGFQKEARARCELRVAQPHRPQGSLRFCCGPGIPTQVARGTPFLPLADASC